MKKNFSLCLLALILCICFVGCGSSKVPPDVNDIIIERTELKFKQSAEIVSMDIIQEDPAHVHFTVRLADGFEFPGYFAIGGTMTFPGANHQHVYFNDVAQRVLDNWPQIAAIAKELNLVIGTPDFVNTGIDPSGYYSNYANIFIDSKNQFDAVGEFLVSVNRLLDFNHVSTFISASIYWGDEKSNVLITSFTFDSYPLSASTDPEQTEKTQKLVDPEVIVAWLAEEWAKAVEKGYISGADS